MWISMYCHFITITKSTLKIAVVCKWSQTWSPSSKQLFESQWDQSVAKMFGRAVVSTHCFPQCDCSIRYFVDLLLCSFFSVRRVHWVVSVDCHTFRQLHHNRFTVVQVWIEIPSELLGQVGFEFLCSLTQVGIYTRPNGKLEKILWRTINQTIL